MRSFGSIAVSLVLSTILLTASRPAIAQQVITTCGTTCTGSCSLGQDLHCTGGIAVTLNHAFLDMGNFSIFCDAGNACDTAVKMTGTDSAVQSATGANSNLEAGTPRIVGEWRLGVDCGNNFATSVAGITFHGIFQTVIKECSQVTQNSIGGFTDNDGALDITFPGVSNIGIQINGHSGDFLSVSGNYVDGVIKPINENGNAANVVWSITNNTINHRNYSFGVNQPAAITLQSVNAVQESVTGNIITGDGTGVITLGFNHTGTYSGNFCRFPLVGCTACVNSGKCASQGTIHSPAP